MPSVRIRLLWGVLAVATGIAWTGWAGGVPLLLVVGYWGAWAWGVVGPGILVHRAVRGRPSTIVGDVALGAVVGLVLQLAAWAVMTALGWQRQLLWWPLPVMALFAAVPRLRGHFSLRRYEQRVPTGAAALAVAGYVVALQGMVQSFRDFTLPPQAMVWYQDDLWNLGNVAELMRTVSPQVAQVAGRPFNYHWFSDAHLAAMSLTTSIDPVTVVGRLWAPPMLLVIAGVALAVGQRLSGSVWVGAGAAAFFAVAPSIEIAWFAPAASGASSQRSPSQIVAVPLTLLAIDIVVSILRGSHRARAWVLLAAVLVACVGAKSSVLPVLAGGLALAALVAGVVARHRLRAVLCLLAVTSAIVLVTRSRLAGGGSGSRLQLLATFFSSTPWQLAHSGEVDSFGTGWLIPGLEAPGAVLVLLLVLACYVISWLWVLLGAAALRRHDLAGWFLLGTGLAGAGAMLVIRHPAYSQIYFLKIAILAWQLLALWGYHQCVTSARSYAGGRPALRSTLAGAALGSLLVALARWAGGPAPSAPSVSAVTSSLGRSLLVATLGVAFAATAVLVARRRLGRPARSLVLVGLASAALSAALVVPAGQALTAFGVGQAEADGSIAVAAVVAALFSAMPGIVPTNSRVLAAVVAVLCATAVVTQSVALSRLAPGRPSISALVTSEEVAAARWLGTQAAPYDVIATNVHCLPTRTAPSCDARAFWVSGLTGRRVLVEGWGYTDAAQAANGRGGLGFARQPFDDPALLALNDGVFTDPTSEKASKLYSLGVRWLFADRRAGPVSTGLAAVASPQFRSGPVTVYRLTSPRPAVTSR